MNGLAQKTEQLASSASGHILWADALRTLACLMVIGIHVCGVGWYTMDTASVDWLVINGADSALRAAVPLFFMLSGTFLLDRDPMPQKLIRRILRLVALWAIFSVLYALERSGRQLPAGPAEFLQQCLQEHFHLWFLRTLACIYLLLPVLRALVAWQDGRWVRWYLVVFLTFGLLRQSLMKQLFPGMGWVRFVPELCGYCGYFVLGWYLRQRVPVPESRYQKLLLAALYLAMAVLIGVATHLCSVSLERNDERMYDYLGVPVAIQAVCLFQLARTWKPGRMSRALARLAPLSLGIYLLHPVMIDLLIRLGLDNTLPKLLYLPLAWLGALLLSAAVTALLRLSPLVRRIF